MSFEINYLEDDDEPEETQSPTRPRIPQATSAPEPNRAPVPPRPQQGSSAWFVCGNESCSHYTSVATGAIEPVLFQKRGRCGACGGLGIDVSSESMCEVCGGSGRRVLSEHMEKPVHLCPWCRSEMTFLQQGGYPAGYPRMETPQAADNEPLRGDVGFGRTRKIS